MSTKCPSCGEIVEGSQKKFCIHCGAALAVESSAAAAGYEFTSEQNVVLTQLARYMAFVGLLMIFAAPMCLIAGVIGLTTGGPEAIGNLIQGLLFLFVGLWTKRASRSFQLVATTAGNDIAHLMDAIIELRKLFRLQYILLLTLIALIGIVFLLALVAAVMQ